jgi:hypothetical protein
MAILAVWDKIGEHKYETGTDRGMLYQYNTENQTYDSGEVWNGLTAVTDSPSGAESNKQYADNIAYLNLISAEDYGLTIEAFSYPDNFGQNDGTAEPVSGVTLGQQARKIFGFSWRTLVGDDVVGTDKGYKIHLAYACQASPSEKSYQTVNDSPEALTFSWEVTTTPVNVGVINGVPYKPTASVVIDSTKFKTAAQKAALAAFEEIIYGKAADATQGTPAVQPRLPLPAEVISLLSAADFGSVVLSDHAVTVEVNDTVTLTATTEPADAVVTWASDDESDATVADGVVTGVAEGTANITASIVVGGVTYTDTCKVTVVPAG